MGDTATCPFCGAECGTIPVYDAHDNIVYMHFCPSCEALEIEPGFDVSQLKEHEHKDGWRLLGVCMIPTDLGEFS